MTFEDHVVSGRYRLLAEIGRGATSVVWQADDERLDRIVALKQLNDPFGSADGADVCEPAIREARLASRIDHPYAIGVHDVFEESGSMYLVLEYLPSRSLTELLADRGPMPPDDVARLGERIASALAVAHAKGVLHGDVSPNNVLVADEGVAKITDFGYSRALGEELSDHGMGVVGTPAFLAPEVAAGRGGGFPSDVFSLGATLYMALEGRPPFGTGMRTTSVLRRIVQGRLIPPTHQGPLTEVVLGMLGNDPGGRPTMDEVVELLRSAVNVGDRQAGRSPRRRVRGLAAAAACLTVVGAVVWTGSDGTPEPQAASAHPPAVAIAGPSGVIAVPDGPVTVLPRPSAVPPSSRAVPSPAPETNTGRSGCTAHFEITSVWTDGAQALVTVHNDRPTRMAGWVVSWKLPAENDIRQLWSGTLSRRGASVAVRDVGWNALLEPDGSASFGMILAVPSGTPGRSDLTCRQS